MKFIWNYVRIIIIGHEAKYDLMETAPHRGSFGPFTVNVHNMESLTTV
jgi:hypothetical protein